MYNLAAQYDVDVLVLECICSAEEAKRRIRNRPKNDGLYCESRKPMVYTRFMEKISREPINQDLLNPENAHVSYMRFDTERDQIFEQRVLYSAVDLVYKVTRILLPTGSYGAVQEEYAPPSLVA